MSLFNEAVLRGIAQTTELSLQKSSDQILIERTIYKAEISYDVFLSHSFKDAELILGLKLYIESLGYSVYVDWIEDRRLDRSKATKTHAAIIKMRMASCKSLLYASSPNASGSVWMPWELGYFDGINGKVAIVPIVTTTVATDQFIGQEYLGIYPYITINNIVQSNQPALWIRTNADNYTAFRAWLEK